MHIVEDTDPITREEAIDLYYKYRDDFLRRLKDGERPQMCIWEDVGDGEYPIYGKALIDLDYRDNLVVEYGKIYKVVEQKIEEPALTPTKEIDISDKE